MLHVDATYYVVGRTSTKVVASDVKSWMVLRTDETLACRAAVDAARCGRLAAWTDRGESPAMDVVRSCFSAEGVMLQARGELTMVPVTFGTEWDDVERDGRPVTYETFLVKMVRGALSCTASDRRFLRGMTRRLGAADGFWDQSRQIGVVLCSDAMRFSQPFAVTKDQSGVRGADATVLNVRHTLLTNGVRAITPQGAKTD